MPTNYTPLADGESPAHTALNQRLQALDSAIVTLSAQPGSLTPWPTATPPSGWLNCDGAAVSRSTYAALFAAIGTTWGSGDGSTTFNIPDGRGRTMAGAGQGSGLTNRTLGQSLGEENHQLTVPEMPSHTHNLPWTSGAATGGAGAVRWTLVGGSETTGSTGTDTPHNNMEPSFGLYWIIKT